VETRTISPKNGNGLEETAAAIINEIDNEIEQLVDVKLSAKRPRQIDLDDLVAVESSDNEIEVDPSKPNTLAIPTFTVDANGQLNFPTPSVEIVRPQERWRWFSYCKQIGGADFHI